MALFKNIKNKKNAEELGCPITYRTDMLFLFYCFAQPNIS